MKKKYERTVLRPMGDATVFKKINQYVAWCELCNVAIRGNGGHLMPYNCDCRIYKYNSESGQYDNQHEVTK